MSFGNLHDVIHSPVVTEKTEELKNPRKDVLRYTFRVHPKANKESIRQALHHLFKVDAKKVNIMRVPGKLKRFQQEKSRTPTWKKAIVTLAPGQSIDLAQGS